MNKEPLSLKDLKYKLERLQDVRFHPDVQKLQREILDKRKPEIDKLKEEIKLLKDKRPAKKQRFPEGTPEHIIKACQEYWNGTTQYHEFYIYVWNDKAVFTGYKSGGYSNNSGWNPTSPAYFLISLTEKESGMHGNKPKELFSIHVGYDKEWSGKRITEKVLKELLEEKTK